jgi:hypothetical protein
MPHPSKAQSIPEYTVSPLLLIKQVAWSRLTVEG